MKPASIRPLAEDDLVERTRRYRDAGGSGLASQFFGAAIEALRSVEIMPGLGSPVLGELVGIDGLRRIGVEGFPCAWYYLERADDQDVIRLLADRRDLEHLVGDGP